MPFISRSILFLFLLLPAVCTAGTQAQDLVLGVVNIILLARPALCIVTGAFHIPGMKFPPVSDGERKQFR